MGPLSPTDSITSLGAIRIGSRHLLAVGTEKSRLLKVDLTNPNQLVSIFYQLPPEHGPVLPHPALNVTNAVFYMISQRSLIRFPIDDCLPYTTCSSCYREQSDCFWDEASKQCDKKSKFPFDVITRGRICPPVVYGFGPQVGPKSGGTVITFYGRDFGESLKIKI